ncbi:MAG: hypothetical protein ACLP7A_01800 [Desulfobaccales bacterium]
MAIEISRAAGTRPHGVGPGVSIGATLDPGAAAGPLLKLSAIGISRAAGTRTPVVGPEAVSIGAPLKPGAPLETAAIVISRAPGTTTHGIGLEAGTIRTGLEAGAAAKPRSGHGAVITRSLGSAIVGSPPWHSNISGPVSAAALVSGSRHVGSGCRCRCVGIGPTPTLRNDVGGAASVTAAVAGAAAVTAAAVTAAGS